MGQAKALWVTVALLFGLCAAHVAAEDGKRCFSHFGF